MKRELTDEEKGNVLPGLLRVNRLLVRAWTLGMLQARSPDERELKRAIGGGMQLPPDDLRPSEAELNPLSGAERLSVADALIVRVNQFADASRLGMLVARDDEQRELLQELTTLLVHGA